MYWEYVPMFCIRDTLTKEKTQGKQQWTDRYTSNTYITRGHDRMVVGFTSSYAISAYHQWCCEFESRSERGVQHNVIKFVSDLRQVDGFLRVLRFTQLSCFAYYNMKPSPHPNLHWNIPPIHNIWMRWANLWIWVLGTFPRSQINFGLFSTWKYTLKYIVAILVVYNFRTNLITPHTSSRRLLPLATRMFTL